MKEGTYNNMKDIIFIQKKRYNIKNNKLVLEQAGGDKDLVPGFPVNQKLKFNEGLMVKAIQNGMILLINYRGDQDEWLGGRERVIYPMTLGVNQNTRNMLLRGWHLNGWSVKERRNTEKVWRLFKTDNIMSMMFTGDFYRLPPAGYRLNDRIMTERIIAQADFNVIRRNQQNLLKEGKIELESEQETTIDKSTAIASVNIRETSTEIDLRDPWANTLMDRRKIDDLRLTIMRSIISNDYIAILGALGKEGRVSKMFVDKKLLGSFKVIKSIAGQEIHHVKIVNGQNIFKLYIFVEKM